MVCYLLSASSTALLIRSKDRRPLTMQALVALPPPTDLTQAPVKQDMDQSDLCAGSSAKIDQLIHLLKLIPHDGKSLVFSQFTSFLDKVVAFYDHARMFALTPWIDWRGIGGT
jgi:SNF2 family DNA or RNA helicase